MENTHTWTCQNDLGMTVQEYASTYKLSYETVRAKIIRYKEELEGHIKIRKKTKYLDDFAVEFLESHRKPKSEFSDELMKTLAQTLKSTLGSTSGEITISSPSNINNASSRPLPNSVSYGIPGDKAVHPQKTDRESSTTDNQALIAQLSEIQQRYEALQKEYTALSEKYLLDTTTLRAQLQYAELAARMMKLGCYLFIAVVGLIGFMNMANTMIMNITTKKQEYGVLQAVGMTNKQLNLCLQLQGLMFTVGTICVALIIGLPLGYALFSYAKHNGIFGMNIYHVPIVPIFIMIFLVGLLQIVLSCVLSSNLKKETLVERIRYQG